MVTASCARAYPAIVVGLLASARIVGPTLLLVASCSLTSLDGYSTHEGRRDGGDSAESGVVGGEPDAASEADDGGVAGRWCETQAPRPAFCADFDDGVVAKGWSSTQVNGGELMLDTNVSRSPPGSFWVRSPGNSTNDNGGKTAALAREFPGTPTDITCAFDVRVDQRDATGKWVAIAWFDIGGEGSLVALFDQSATPLVYEEARAKDGAVDYIYHAPSEWLEMGEWRRIALHLTLTSGGGHVTMAVDDKQAVDTPLSPKYTPGRTRFSLGITYMEGQSGPYEAHFDNVTCDAK